MDMKHSMRTLLSGIDYIKGVALLQYIDLSWVGLAEYNLFEAAVKWLGIVSTCFDRLTYRSRVIGLLPTVLALQVGCFRTSSRCRHCLPG